MIDELLEATGVVGIGTRNEAGTVRLILTRGEAGMTADLYNKLSEVAERHGYIITSIINRTGTVQVKFKESDGQYLGLKFDYGAIAKEIEDGN